MTQKRRILIVDDSDFLVEMVLHYFKLGMPASEFDIFTAGDGRAALEIMERQKPDLVLLDIMMPRMDGLTLCEHIRRNDKLKNVKIAMVTVLDGTDERRKAKEVGADEYIVKPSNPMDLVTRVKVLLEELKPAP